MDVDGEINNRAQLEDVGQNADLYIANQEARLVRNPRRIYAGEHS